MQQRHICEFTHAICRALVPRTRALSYLVMYGVVILFWFACCPSPAGRICTFSWSSFKHTIKKSISAAKRFWNSPDDKPKYCLKGNCKCNRYTFCSNSVQHFLTQVYYITTTVLQDKPLIWDGLATLNMNSFIHLNVTHVESYIFYVFEVV